eukprot:15364597-Ditylum_brightwellii.AAC.2
METIEHGISQETDTSLKYPLILNYNITQVLHQAQQDSSVNNTYMCVETHQAVKKHHSQLSLEAKLNINCDQQASQFHQHFPV